MNMSTADDQWRALFKGEPATKTWDSVKTRYEDKPFMEDWGAKWADWVTTAYEISKEEHGKSLLAANAPPTTPWAKQAAHATINETLTELEKLQKQLAQAKTNAKETLPTQARHKISEALYGDTVTNNKAEAGKTTADNTYATSCVANGGKSLWGDILCLCGVKDGSAAADCAQTKLTIAWSTNPLAAIQTVKAACPTAKSAKLTPSLIRALIQRVDAKIKRSENGNALVYSLGKPTADSCTGDTGALCVILRHTMQRGTPNRALTAFHGLPSWTKQQIY
uniref:Variant surface glycoprotein 1125.2945 n=1 Tax=Trypanosoma brucei TaxID=5691 RepID=A0A1J0R8W8_9TRYP|nr:variant surface glycoprotein 1125.2945 [Trypanosoma brucei]